MKPYSRPLSELLGGVVYYVNTKYQLQSLTRAFNSMRSLPDFLASLYTKVFKKNQYNRKIKNTLLLDQANCVPVYWGNMAWSLLIMRHLLSVYHFNPAILICHLRKIVENNPQNVIQFYFLNQCEIEVIIHFAFREHIYLTKYTRILDI